MLRPTAVVVIAPGFEELEAIAPIDLLRRAGVLVTLATIGDELATAGRNNISVKADVLLADAPDAPDLLVIIGGPGYRIAMSHQPLLERIRAQHAAGRMLGAICAGPIVLRAADILHQHAYTCHFSVAAELPERDPDRAVVQDRNVITAQGAGSAAAFALALVAALCGKETAVRVAAEIAYPHALPAAGNPVA